MCVCVCVCVCECVCVWGVGVGCVCGRVNINARMTSPYIHVGSLSTVNCCNQYPYSATWSYVRLSTHNHIASACG